MKKIQGLSFEETLENYDFKSFQIILVSENLILK